MPDLRLMTILSLAFAILPFATASTASPPTRAAPVVGEAWLLAIDHQEAQRSGNGSSSSSGHDAIVERVVAVTAEGGTYEYDLPPDATAQDRSRQWQLPVRLFRSNSGAMQIVDVGALERRIDAWLASGRMSRIDCGRWIFTWNAFRIDCDANGVIAMIEPFLLPRVPLSDDMVATHPAARATGRFMRAADGSYGATLDLDPAVVRHTRAEGAVVVGGIVNRPVTIEAATASWAHAEISGTIAIRLDTAPDGLAYRRVTQTTTVIAGMGDDNEQGTATETLTRTPLSPPPPSRAGV